MAGWGGSFPLFLGAASPPQESEPVNQLLVFRLNAKEQLPALTPLSRDLPKPPELQAGVEVLARGKYLYHIRCAMCHGESATSGGVIPDLRYLSGQTHAEWYAIVLGGSRSKNGMPSFGQVLSPADADAIHAYVVGRAKVAWDALAAEQGMQ
jgi:mono/diheme cytochrome c family protein